MQPADSFSCSAQFKLITNRLFRNSAWDTRMSDAEHGPDAQPQVCDTDGDAPARFWSERSYRFAGCLVPPGKDIKKLCNLHCRTIDH